MWPFINTMPDYMKSKSVPLREKCPYSDFFWSVFFCIRAEYGEIRSISPYSVRMQKNTDQTNSEYGQFSSSVHCSESLLRVKILFQILGPLALIKKGINFQSPFQHLNVSLTLPQLNLFGLLKIGEVALIIILKYTLIYYRFRCDI